MDLDGKVILITGAARRVGRAIALACASRGSDIALHYRSSAREARETAEEIRGLGRRVALLRADLADRKAVAALPRRAARALGRLDGVVASASVYRHVPFARLNEKAWDLHIEANLTSSYLLAIAAARVMKRGAMVLVGDVMGLRPYRDLLPYGVSKAGVIHLSQALALALAPRIRVNCLCPGPVLPPERLSPARRRAVARATPLGIGSPERAAEGVVFLLENDYATGAVLAVDGGRNIAHVPTKG